MAGNDVVKKFPGTRAVFERLFIDMPWHGSCGLDELAWNRGVDLRGLLAKLEEFATHPLAVISVHGRGVLQTGLR